MDNSEQRKVNTIAKQLGATLITNGQDILKGAFKVSPKKILSKSELGTWLKNNTFPGASLWDEKYYFEDISFYNSLIKHYWGFHKKYITDRYDCDNYAFAFSSMVSDIFGINTAGVASGEVYNKDTDKLIDRHAYNLIVAKENGKLKPFLFEPMKNMITEWKGQKTELDVWKYVIQWQEFF